MTTNLSDQTLGESRAAVEASWDSLRAQMQEFGVPSIETLMSQVDDAVFKLHGPVPTTPTWEDELLAWTARQLGETATEKRPQIIEGTVVPAGLSPGIAAAKALPASAYKKSSRR